MPGNAAVRHVMIDYPEIERIDVDLKLIAIFRSEGDFIGLAVSLLVEASSYVYLLANLLPYET